MRLTAKDQEESSDSEPCSYDLMWGISPRHIRQLCENSWNGGREYTPNQVGDMTLDQIFISLSDIKNLRSGNKTVRKYNPLEVTSRANKEGLIKGRAADGTPFMARISGKSLAQRIREKQEEEKKKEQKILNRKKRREKRGNRTS